MCVVSSRFEKYPPTKKKKTFCYFFPNASMIRIRSVCDYAIVRAAAMWE